MNEPVELVELRATVRHARGVFRESVHQELLALLALAAPFEDAIGEVGRSEALDAWRERAIAALAQRYRND